MMRSLVPIASVLVASFLLTAACGPHAKQEPLDSARWKAAPLYGTDETRLHMLDDAEKRIRGMKRADVEALLGPQSDPAYFKGWDLRYWLGPNDLDSWWLLIKLRDGVVTELRVASD
ncbi:MAG: hypothetical protein ACRELY_26545 [Polyangiaceae bacterium]